MGTPAAKRKVINLSRYAEDMRNLRQAREDKKKIEAYIKTLETRLKKAAGNAESAEIDGVEAFTYAKTESFAWAKFIEEHGDIADKYRITVEKETYDFDAIRADHPTLVAPFQTRQFLVK